MTCRYLGADCSAVGVNRISVDCDSFIESPVIQICVRIFKAGVIHQVNACAACNNNAGSFVFSGFQGFCGHFHRIDSHIIYIKYAFTGGRNMQQQFLNRLAGIRNLNHQKLPILGHANDCSRSVILRLAILNLCTQGDGTGILAAFDPRTVIQLLLAVSRGLVRPPAGSLENAYFTGQLGGSTAAGYIGNDFKTCSICPSLFAVFKAAVADNVDAFRICAVYKRIIKIDIGCIAGGNHKLHRVVVGTAGCRSLNLHLLPACLGCGLSSKGSVFTVAFHKDGNVRGIVGIGQVHPHTGSHCRITVISSSGNAVGKCLTGLSGSDFRADCTAMGIGCIGIDSHRAAAPNIQGIFKTGIIHQIDTGSTDIYHTGIFIQRRCVGNHTQTAIVHKIVAAALCNDMQNHFCHSTVRGRCIHAQKCPIGSNTGYRRRRRIKNLIIAVFHFCIQPNAAVLAAALDPEAVAQGAARVHLGLMPVPVQGLDDIRTGTKLHSIGTGTGCILHIGSCAAPAIASFKAVIVKQFDGFLIRWNDKGIVKVNIACCAGLHRNLDGIVHTAGDLVGGEHHLLPAGLSLWLNTSVAAAFRTLYVNSDLGSIFRIGQIHPHTNLQHTVYIIGNAVGGRNIVGIAFRCRCCRDFGTVRAAVYIGSIRIDRYL